jgi:hypothetical protein
MPIPMAFGIKRNSVIKKAEDGVKYEKKEILYCSNWTTSNGRDKTRNDHELKILVLINISTKSALNGILE